MFESHIEIDVVAMFGMCLIDCTTVDIFPCSELKNPMEALPMIISAIEYNKFFEDASYMEVNLEDM